MTRLLSTKARFVQSRMVLKASQICDSIVRYLSSAFQSNLQHRGKPKLVKNSSHYGPEGAYSDYNFELVVTRVVWVSMKSKAASRRTSKVIDL
jgi:hypothetical protein